MMAISDIHLLAPSLFDDGKAAQHLDASDMKMVLSSDLIMQRMVDEIIAEKPQLLLISGDLTFNGERASHERLVEHLQRLEKAGIRTYVIPGNHDVMCPYGKQYVGESPCAVPTVTKEEFAQIYGRFGYGNASERDPNSLSYTCEPLPGLVLLAIDSNRYDENQLSADGSSVEYHNDGAVKPETLEWIEMQLGKAKIEDKRVIAMMHHHLLEHIDGEAKLLPNYIVANHNEVASMLNNGGVSVVFTGHLHITDAVTSNGITDVATGSASTYPLPMRTMTIDRGMDSITIATSFFTGIDSDLLLQGKQRVENSAEAIAGLIARRLWPKLNNGLDKLKLMLASQGIELGELPQSQQQLTALLIRHLKEPLAQSLIMITQGGEDPAQAAAVIGAIKNGVKGMLSELIPKGGDDIADFLMEELLPRVEPILRSALEDLNQVDTPQQSATDDHNLVIRLCTTGCQ